MLRAILQHALLRSDTEGPFFHALHRPCVEPIVPDEAAQELAQGPAFVPASVKYGIFQEIRLLFQSIKALAATADNVAPVEYF